MKCSACHLAVPLLTPFGQAFRDNGYRMKTGTTTCGPMSRAIGPVRLAVERLPGRRRRVAGQTVQRQGGFANGAFVFGGMGSISDKVSFRMFPVVYEDGFTFAGHGWIRYNQAFGTDWVNIKVGQSELDVPINPGREYNMGNARFAVLYAYTVPGSVSRFNVLFPQPGVEIMGHDRGSRTATW